MDDTVVTILAVGLPSLLTLYWICLIVGGGLLVISSVGGGDTGGVDADVDVDIDVQVDTDLSTDHVHATSLASWFSVQFVVFFMAMFGLVGVTMTHLGEQTGLTVAIVALFSGLAVGQGAHQVIRRLRMTSGDSTPQGSDYVNKLARVTITVTGSSKGEIVLRVGRSDRYIPALSKREADTFSPDQQVGVVGYGDGVAEVISRQEFDFLHESDSQASHSKGGSS